MREQLETIETQVEDLACQISTVQGILELAVFDGEASLDVQHAIHGAIRLLKSANEQGGEIALALGRLNKTSSLESDSSEPTHKVDLWNVRYTSEEVLGFLDQGTSLLKAMLRDERLNTAA